MSKVFYANFFNALKSLFLKSAVYPQAYHLSNFAFAKIFHGEKDVNSTIFPHAGFPSAVNDSKRVSSSYLVRGFQEYFFSNYFKINNYVLIKYFLTVSKFLDSGSNNLLFFSAKAASSAAKKKTERILKTIGKKKLIRVKKTTIFKREGKKKKLLFKKVGKRISMKASGYRKVFFSIVSLMKRYFIFFTEKSDDEKVGSRPILYGYPRFKKSITKSRGYFYYPVKKREKYFKSKKKLRLFKKFVRKYTYNVRAPINFKKLLGYAQFFFRVAGCKKRFKQKIYIRSAIKKFYKVADNKKMYTR